MKYKFISFEECKKFAGTSKIKTGIKWKQIGKLKKLPNNVPSRPDHVYRNKGWTSWGDFLGTDNLSGTAKSLMWVSYDDAEKFAHSLNLISIEEWKNYYKFNKMPKNVPKAPDQSYKNKGWIDWGTFLGTGYVANQNRDYHSFENSKKVAKQIGITKQIDWRKYAIKNKSLLQKLRIPANPEGVYSKEWTGWGDWLGTGTVAYQDKVFLNFNEARAFAHTLNFKNRKNWEEFSKSKDKPENVPANPGLQYKNKGWGGWGDWLGTGTVANQNKEYLSAIDAKPVLKKLFKENNINNLADWQRFAPKNKELLEKLNIPSEILKFYNLEKAKKKVQREKDGKND